MLGLFFLPATAIAAPAPTAGPTTGGTLVSGPAGITFTQVSAGYSHSVAIGSDGKTYAWGDNEFGQLGDGSTTTSTVPIVVSAVPGVDFIQVSAGFGFTIAIGSDGNSYSWGYNNYGQLGNGNLTSRSAPGLLATPPGVTFSRVSAGLEFVLASGANGNTYAWGHNNRGQLGNGNVVSQTAPVLVATPPGVTFAQVSAGFEHSLAIGSDGNSYAWGDNNLGELGDGTVLIRTTPVTTILPPGVTFTYLSGGFAHSSAIGSDGNTYSWGSNINGQLGNGTTANELTPVTATLPAGVTFTRVYAGDTLTVALGSDGNTYSWGQNLSGALGDGTTIQRLSPVRVDAPPGVTFTQISTGGFTSLAITAAGRTYSWGSNSDGQIGDGTNVSRLSPVVITDATINQVFFGALPGSGLSQAGNTWTVATPTGCGPVDIVVDYTQFGRVQTETTNAGFLFGQAPIVTLQPVPAVVGFDSRFMARVSATGDDSPSVQWQQLTSADGTWSNVPGATSDTLSVNVPTSTVFRAVFTNCVGEIITDAVTATVQVPPETPGEKIPPAAKELTHDASLASTGADYFAGIVTMIALFGAGIAATFTARRKSAFAPRT